MLHPHPLEIDVSPSSRATTAPAAGASPAQQPLTGRILLILGVVLLGLTLRHAVTGMAPFLATIRTDLSMGQGAATLLGMLPTLFFGAAGFLAPVLIRRSSLEVVAFAGMALAALGTGLRVATDSVPLFLTLSAVALLGMGFGNVVGAPLVKKYFPDRQSTMLTVFALLMQAGATIPAMTAMPLAGGDPAAWRTSMLMWAFASVVAAVPWLLQIFRARSAETAAAGSASTQDSARTFGLAYLLRNPVSLGTGVFYAVASLITYAMLAWMPVIIQATAGVDQPTAAAAYSIFTFMTLPLALISPIVGTKMRNALPYAAALVVLPAVGLLGLVLAPGLFWVWSVLIGLIGGAFPLAIAHFNTRTRTQEGSGAIAGFAMGIGYLVGTVGPLLGGWLNPATGGWTVPLVIYAVLAVPMLLAAVAMTKPDRYLEDAAERS